MYRCTKLGPRHMPTPHTPMLFPILQAHIYLRGTLEGQVQGISKTNEIPILVNSKTTKERNCFVLRDLKFSQKKLKRPGQNS